MRWIRVLPTPRDSAIAHEETVVIHLQLYTPISYIFVVQSLHERWFKVYTSLQQGVRYCGPVIQVNGSAHAKSGGHWSCLAGGC